MSRKAKKAQEALEAAMRQAADDASKLFRQHERDRRVEEHSDRADLDSEMFVAALEEERLLREKVEYADFDERMSEVRRLVLQEHKKHLTWSTISDATSMPDVYSQCEINAFLSSWREQDYPNIFPRDESSVLVTLREDQMNTPAWRRRSVDLELSMCHQARLLSDAIMCALDEALVAENFEVAAKLRQSARFVNLQIFASLDKITMTILQFGDTFFEMNEELLVRWCPRHPEETFPDGEKDIKYGLWARMRTSEMTRHLPHLKFNDIGMLLEPKEGSQRLPRALGLARDNVALRCIQLSFDPLSVFCSPQAGQEYYALDCVLLVEPLAGHERIKTQGEYIIRVDAPSSHVLVKHRYNANKSSTGEGGSMDDGELKLTFQVPQSVVLRHPGDPLVGIWNDAQLKWDPCRNRCSQMVVRRTSLNTTELATMAIIQEKGFDVPYASWQLIPLSDERALFVIEGRADRGERLQDREIKILIREHECKLFAPTDRPELASLRDTWTSPATLLRKLSKAGYNFLLADSDAEYIDVKPKCAEMERKGYADIALLCTNYVFASSRHNKVEVVRENDCMSLFRISKSRREEGGNELVCDVDDDTAWTSVRYERDRCVHAAFRDMNFEPDLSNLPGKETHLNLLMMLKAEARDPLLVESAAIEASKLLQQSVFQLLMLTRPFSWG